MLSKSERRREYMERLRLEALGAKVPEPACRPPFSETCSVPVATVLSSMAVVTRLAHAEADRRMAAPDHPYNAACAAVDAMLPTITPPDLGLPHAKPTRAQRDEQRLGRHDDRTTQLRARPGHARASCALSRTAGDCL